MEKAQKSADGERETSKTNLGEKDNLMKGHTFPAFVSLN